MPGPSVPEPQASTDTYVLIRQAIEKRQQVIATYHGYRRVMCPHSIGVNRNGDRQALFYQFGAESSRGVTGDVRLSWWRHQPAGCSDFILVALLNVARLTAHPFSL